MHIAEEIAQRVRMLAPDLQERVLAFTLSLRAEPASCETGSGVDSLLPFVSTLDAQSAREMTAAIEAECERVDAGHW